MSNSLPENTDVVIIDSTLSRAEAMARSFRAAGCQVIRFLDDEGNLQQTLANVSELKCFIKLWHFGDQEYKEPTVSATLTVYYGGHGGLDPRKKPNEEGERIWRRVGSEDNALNEKEAEKLVAYAKAILKGTHPLPPKPPFLSLPLKIYALSTLAVLCKGYLTVHAAADSMKEYSVATDFHLADIQHALKEIGWDELQEDREALQNMIGGLSEHVPLVRSPEWWRKPCLGEDMSGSRSCKEQLEKFARVAQEEWSQIKGLVQPLPIDALALATHLGRPFKPVQALLDAIKTDGVEIQPAVVAKAYLSMSEVLKSKGRI
jgi:hypothetical protein